MKGIGTGFALLKQGKYLEALNRFKEGLAKARDPNVIKTCLYGKSTCTNRP